MAERGRGCHSSALTGVRLHGLSSETSAFPDDSTRSGLVAPGMDSGYNKSALAKRMAHFTCITGLSLPWCCCRWGLYRLGAGAAPGFLQVGVAGG